MYKHGDACPLCGGGNLCEKVIEEHFSYKGHSLLVPDYRLLECSACGEMGLLYGNGLIFSDRHKVFVSYHHSNSDQMYRNHFENLFVGVTQELLQEMTEKIVREINPRKVEWEHGF